MVRVITQETYDEVVKENIEEFEMSPEEAVKEAVAQFEAQGVDLSNIIKDLALAGGDDHLVCTTVTKLKGLCSSDNNDDEILKELEILKTECNKDIAHRVRAGKEGAYKILIDLLEARQKIYLDKKNDKDAEFMLSILNTLIALMDVQPDLLDERGVNLIISILDKAANEDVLIATLKWASTCCLKHEMNRQMFFAKHIGKRIKNILNTKNVKAYKASLLLLRRMTLDDDVRVEFGKAHEHARELGIETLDELTRILKEQAQCAEVSGEAMLAMAALLVRHELCAAAAPEGVPALFHLLADNFDKPATVVPAVKLITALAGNDDVKRAFIKSGIVPIIVSLLSRHTSNATASALTLKCIAALTLREPLHGREFLENGAPEAIVECMKVHHDNSNVQKNACWAIRNMVARCREHNSKFHELGIEAILNKAYDNFSKEFGFDIKSALRDLGCEVKLDEQWTGKGVQMKE